MGLGVRAGLLGVVAASMGWSGTAVAQDRTLLDTLADSQAIEAAQVLQAQHKYRPLCDTNVAPGFARCLTRVRVDDNGSTIHSDAVPAGLGATDLQSAYKIPATGGGGKIIALIDWYDDASAETDLATYRTQYGLPACTTANGCFQKVDQSGGTSYPQASSCDQGAGESSLDIEMASAACPDCHILLVEATDSSQQNLDAALATAVKLGAVAISNSYGGPEQGTGAESSYTHTGIIITAAAGDQGYGASYPATSAGVIAVGGTNLVKSSSSRGWAETVWNDQSGATGSGCSSAIKKPSWQTDPSCGTRMEADVSAAAEGTDGILEVCGGQWVQIVGTSAACPLVAGILVVAGQSSASFTPEWAWTNKADFYDVISGSNGSCTTSYYCTAAAGFDGPTGWGTPNGALISGTASGSSSGSGSGSGSSTSSGSSGSSSSGSSTSSGSSSGGSTSSGSGSGSSTSSGGGSGSTSSSSGGGSGSSGSGSSSGVTTHTADGGTSANNDNVGWNPQTPSAGCGCTMMDAGEDFGGLAVGVGLLLGTGLRRRRRSR